MKLDNASKGMLNYDLREGYYVSAFVCINEIQNILDIKIRHDQTIALWKYSGECLELIRYWELERISGIKMHPKAFYDEKAFYKLLSDLLKEEQIELTDILGIWGTRGFEHDSLYREQFDAQYAFHSIAHLLTAICFENTVPMKDCILGMALDAGPDSNFEKDAYERLYYTGCLIKDGKIDIFSVESPARLWSYSYKRFGLREGTLMALANAIDIECPVSKEMLAKWEEYEFYNEQSRRNAQELVDKIYDYVLDYVHSHRDAVIYDKKFSEEENHLSMLIKIVNQISLDIVCRNIERVIKGFDLDPTQATLALAGGFSLNCPTNTALIQQYGFKGYQIPPCASDTGIALGVGLAVFYQMIVSGRVKPYINSSYYGQMPGEIQGLKERMPDKVVAVRESSMQEFAELLEVGEVLVWVNGSAEIGPRALGNRSLIADARTNRSKDLLNDIKKRQWWRPVAPIILDEYGEKYFKNYISTYNMLLNLQVKEEHWDSIQAVIHHDGSARVQSVSQESNSVLYNLLSAFYDLTGVPVLCNTSLNDAGEPIINRIDEAVTFAYNKGLRYVCVNGKYIVEVVTNSSSSEQCHKSSATDKLVFHRNMEYFTEPDEVDKDEIIAKFNPHGLDVEELTYYYDNPNLFDGIDITNTEDAKLVAEKTQRYLQKNRFGLKR